MHTLDSLLFGLRGTALATIFDSDIVTSSGRISASWFASTSGNAANPGTIGSPFDLATAFSGAGGKIQAGDTVWIRGGTYTGLWVISMQAQAGAPVIYRNYNGERVTLDGYVSTTLSGTITNVVTSIPMAQLSVPDGAFIDIDSETIRIHTYSGGNYVSVDRGWNGTTAAGHTSGATIRTEAGSCVTMTGKYCWLWGVECTVSVSRFTNRVNPQTGSNPFGRDAIGIDIQGTGNKCISPIVHDCSDGISTANVTADNWECHGALVYYTGWDAADRGHGHHFYFHNDNPGTSLGKVGASVGLSAFDIGGQIYTGGSVLGNITVDSSLCAQSGVLAATAGSQDDWLFGMNPGNTATFLSILNSLSYNAVGVGNIGIDWGYQGSAVAIDHPTMIGCYFANQGAACVYKTMTNDVCTGNTFVGPSSAPAPGNTNPAWKPGSGKNFFILKNLYEPGRAFIVVYNWDHSATVNLDLSTFLNNGDTYVVRNAWNYFGATLASGTWNGTPFAVNTSGLTIAAPVGKTAPAETGTEFNVYVVSKT